MNVNAKSPVKQLGVKSIITARGRARVKSTNRARGRIIVRARGGDGDSTS